MKQQIKDCLAWIKPRLKEFNSDLICRVFAQIEINIANTRYDSAIKQLQRLLGLLPSESEAFAVVRALILRLNGTYVIPQEEGAPPPLPSLLRQSPNPKTDKETQTFTLSEVERSASTVELVELGSQTTEEFSFAETFYRVFGGKNCPHLSHSNFAPLQALDPTSNTYTDTSTTAKFSETLALRGADSTTKSLTESDEHKDKPQKSSKPCDAELQDPLAEHMQDFGKLQIELSRSTEVWDNKSDTEPIDSKEKTEQLPPGSLSHFQIIGLLLPLLTPAAPQKDPENMLNLTRTQTAIPT